MQRSISNDFRASQKTGSIFLPENKSEEERSYLLWQKEAKVTQSLATWIFWIL
jgi:hypothetical protein